MFRWTTVCPSFKNLLSNSQTLRQCYFHLLWKRFRSVWEFDNKFLNDGHRCLADIWRTITFNVILTITNATSKNLPSSGTKWLPIMTCIHPSVHLYSHLLPFPWVEQNVDWLIDWALRSGSTILQLNHGMTYY